MISTICTQFKGMNLLKENVYHAIDSYRGLHQLQAEMLDENNEDEEMIKVLHLVEAHSPVFRLSAINLFGKASHNGSFNIFPMNCEHLKFNCCTDSQMSTNIEDVLLKVEMMPSQWTIVQLTNMNFGSITTKPTSLQITVFQCGQNTVKPFTITAEPGLDPWGKQINIMQVLYATVEEINLGYVKLKDKLQGRMKESYTEFKTRINHELQQHVKYIQDSWLGEWRILLTGKFTDDEIEKEIDDHLKKLLSVYDKDDSSMKKRQILKCLLRCQAFITDKESKKILEICFPDIETQDVISVIKKIKKFEEYGKSGRDPVILIVDDTIDQVPWEMLNVFQNQPVSRMQSFHFTYALFQAHEDEIKDGHKIIHTKEIKNGLILNPSANLPRHETRLRFFHQYWLKDWKSMIGQLPTEEEFLDYVINCDTFMYSGHGDGMQYVKYQSLQKLRINAVVLLFGCSSVALKCTAPSEEASGSNQHYIRCCCPCIVGNLYSVTDLDCDYMSTHFLSTWMPTPGNKAHWLDLDLSKWAPGTTDNLKLAQAQVARRKHIPDLLLALNKSKKSAKCCYVTQAACIARGLPVRLV